MIIQANLTDSKTSFNATVEVEKDCISISFMNTSAGINICMNNGHLTAYIYPHDSNDPEIIFLARA